MQNHRRNTGLYLARNTTGSTDHFCWNEFILLKAVTKLKFCFVFTRHIIRFFLLFFSFLLLLSIFRFVFSRDFLTLNKTFNITFNIWIWILVLCDAWYDFSFLLFSSFFNFLFSFFNFLFSFFIFQRYFLIFNTFVPSLSIGDGGWKGSLRSGVWLVESGHLYVRDAVRSHSVLRGIAPGDVCSHYESSGVNICVELVRLVWGKCRWRNVSWIIYVDAWWIWLVIRLTGALSSASMCLLYDLLICVFYIFLLNVFFCGFLFIQKHLKFPDDGQEVSEHAKDLMKRLICNSEHRLGQNGLKDFAGHPFFKGIDWATLREGQPPYVPEVSSPTDTSNFDIEESDVRQPVIFTISTWKFSSGCAFVGF